MRLVHLQTPRFHLPWLAVAVSVLGWLLLGCTNPHVQDNGQIKHRVSNVDWDNPKLRKAVSYLEQLDLSLEEKQAHARQVLAEHGVVSSQIVLAPVAQKQALIQEINRLAPARCAIQNRLVLCCRSLVELDRTPVRQAFGDSLVVTGRGLGSAQVVEVLHLLPSGHMTTLPLEKKRRSFAARSNERLGAGRHTLEIMVTTDRGIEVAGLWFLYVDAKKQPPFVDRPGPDGDLDQAAKRYFDTLQQDRAGLGLPALRWSGALANAAQQRAQSTATDGRLVHLRPQLTQDWVDDAGLPFSWLAENLARAQSLEGARHVIMESPSHRRNRLSTSAQQAGVGLAWADSGNQRTLFIVELFGRSFSGGSRQQLSADILRQIEQLRTLRGADPLQQDPALDAAAQHHATEMSHAQRLFEDVSLQQTLTQAVLANRRDLTQAGAALFRVDSAQAFVPTEQLLQSPYNRIGIGAFRENKQSPWYIVVLVARSR